MNASTDSQSAQYYFISYCRQEVTFVDSFSWELQKRGFRTWVDFRQLVPGQPWQPQLDNGVENAAAILLVVSKASMASAPVKDEWTKSLACGKRIILILFEPCKVDPGLACLEWVDFTGSFDTALNQLISVLTQPKQMMTPPPVQAGVRLPGAAKIFYGLSILAAILTVLGGFVAFIITMGLTIEEIFMRIEQNLPDSTSAYETNEIRSLITSGGSMSVILLWIPAIWNFVQIPWRIRKRTHNAGQLSGALSGLVFANLFLLLVPLSQAFTNIWADFNMGPVIENVLYCSMPLMLLIFAVCLALYLLMISDSMYRWAGPTGAILRVARPDLPKRQKKGQALRVAIESAPQDRLYAEALRASLMKAGHTRTESFYRADVVLPLLSAYKNSSNCDPQRKRMIPVLLQRCDVDPRLSQVQWVDLRYGRASIDAVANLLNEPDELLQTLGVLPIRTSILPSGVRRLIGALSIVLPISVVFAIGYLLSGMPESGQAILLNLLIAAEAYLLRRYILARKFKYLPFLSYGWVLGFVVLLAIQASFAQWDPIWFTLPFAWLVPLLMFSKDVRMWLPAR